MEIVNKLLSDSKTYVFEDTHQEVDTCWKCDQQYRHILIYCNNKKDRKIEFGKRFISIYIYDNTFNEDICDHSAIVFKHKLSKKDMVSIEQQKPELYKQLQEYYEEINWKEREMNDTEHTEKNISFWFD